MIHIDDAIYKAIAKHIIDEVGGRNYVSNLSIEVEHNNTTYLFTISAYIYRCHIMAPDGEWDEIRDIVPVWWELHTYNDDGDEVLNDGEFVKIKEFIC